MKRLTLGGLKKIRLYEAAKLKAIEGLDDGE